MLAFNKLTSIKKMDSLNKMVWNEEIIDLNTLSMENLKEILQQLKDNEAQVKQDLDDMITKLA